VRKIVGWMMSWERGKKRITQRRRVHGEARRGMRSGYRVWLGDMYRVADIYRKTKMRGEECLSGGGGAARTFEAPFASQGKQGKHAPPLQGTIEEEKKEGRAEARPYRGGPGTTIRAGTALRSSG
jgi:hypothetical protein